MRSPNPRDRLEKMLLSLGREHQRLMYARWHAPIVPLEHAFQRGWEKTYVLREDIRRRPDLRVFSDVLAAVNQRVYSRNREFQDGNGRQIVLHPRIIPVAEWSNLGWTAGHLRLFAYGHWREEEKPWLSERWRPHILGYRLVRTWWLEESIRSHMVTHQQVDMPEVRRRLAEIDRFISAHGGWQRLGRLHGSSHWWRRLSFARFELRQMASDESQLSEAVT